MDMADAPCRWSMRLKKEQDAVQEHHRRACRDAEKVADICRLFTDRDAFLSLTEQHTVPGSEGTHAIGDVTLASQARIQCRR